MEDEKLYWRWLYHGGEKAVCRCDCFMEKLYDLRDGKEVPDQTGLYHRGGKEVPDWAVSQRWKRSPRLGCIIEVEKKSQAGLYHKGGIEVPDWAVS
jgi:hypothetical protein